MNLSYSLYAFNSLDEGKNWIENLFHKNDSYQVPIVLNPYREYGNININTENYLTRQRLLSVLLSNPDYLISDNLSVDYIKVTLKEPKGFFIITENMYGKDYTLPENKKHAKDDFYKILNDSNFSILFNNGGALINNGKIILDEFKKRLNIQNIPSNIKYELENYILYKIINICEKYIAYNEFINEQEINIKGFLDRLEKNNSHILFKLKQTVNFITYYDEIWKRFIENEERLYIQKLATELKKKVTGRTPLIELLPPPIYDVFFLSKEKIDILSSISSGEKQLVYSISTILYHISNINSIEKDKRLVKYKYVNIILDEVELYFHPEFQRKFISDLLKRISELEIPNIKGINIIFLTHSPFILSDIPNVNIMYLKVNENGHSVVLLDERKSFAANIHHLLADSFFFDKNIYIGEFAKEKINEVIHFLNENDKRKNKEETDYYYHLIQLIDEPILKNKLLQMLYNFDTDFYEEKEEKIKKQQIITYAKQIGYDLDKESLNQQRK